MKHRLSRLGRWARDRLSEKSTFTGFALLAAAGGRHIPDAVMDAITWWVPFLSGALIAIQEDEQPK